MMNTEETFVLSSLKEFVRMWGSGTQALFHIECQNRKAFIKMSTQLGAPAECHFLPSFPDKQHQGYHGDEVKTRSIPRKKGAAQRERDRARAAAHRAKQNTAAAADLFTPDDSPTLLPPATAGQTAGPAPPSSAASAGPPVDPPPSAASAGLPVDPPPSAASAGPPVDPPPSAVSAGQTPAAQPVASPADPIPPPSSHPPPAPLGAVAAAIGEVNDELVQERNEVKIVATAIFENCPDDILSEEYILSLQKFIFSESHLQSNIADAKFKPSSSRQISHEKYIHTVAVEMIVKTASLEEPPTCLYF